MNPEQNLSTYESVFQRASPSALLPVPETNKVAGVELHRWSRCCESPLACGTWRPGWCRSRKEREINLCPLWLSGASSWPAGESVLASVQPLPGPQGYLRRKRRCRDAPGKQERPHEQLQFMSLKERQHLGTNYCNLKGGHRPVSKAEIQKQCLTFF